MPRTIDLQNLHPVLQPSRFAARQIAWQAAGEMIEEFLDPGSLSSAPRIVDPEDIPARIAMQMQLADWLVRGTRLRIGRKPNAIRNGSPARR